MVMLISNIEQWCSAMWMASPVWELAKDSEQHSCVLGFIRQYKTFTLQCVCGTLMHLNCLDYLLIYIIDRNVSICTFKCLILAKSETTESTFPVL